MTHAMDLETKAKVFRKVLELLRPVRWRIPDNFLTREHFERVVYSLDFTSSPGYPYMLQAPTNRILFGYDDKTGTLDPVKLDYIWEIVKYNLNNRKADPIRLFIKPEPLSDRKINAKKYRLISSVSVVDQIIDHMLFGTMNSLLIEKCNETPVKTGWTPMTGGWKSVPCQNIVSTDKSSFDWTVSLWMVQAELEIRMNLCDNLTDEWKNLAAFRYKKLFLEPIFITSGGLQLRQNFPGVMKSGCVNTISSNSIIQLLIHFRVAEEVNEDIKFMWAMGDDVIQENKSDEYFDHLARYCILKEKSSHIEFAGYRFGRNIEPLYFGKHAFMLLNQKEKFIEETADSYALLYHRSSRRSLVREILQELKKDLVTEEFLDQIWDE